MQWDPTRWLISLAGFIYDWIITREWSRSLLCFLPVFLLVGIVVAAASGNWRDRDRLAQWYLELGDEEIAEWEQSWAPAAGGEAESEVSSGAKLVSVTSADAKQGQAQDRRPIGSSSFRKSAGCPGASTKRIGTPSMPATAIYGRCWTIFCSAARWTDTWKSTCTPVWIWAGSSLFAETASPFTETWTVEIP